MTFNEWVERHGLEFTMRWWGIENPHIVFIIKRGHSVGARMGTRFMGSNPLGNGESITDQIFALCDAVCWSFTSAEFIID